MLLAARSGVGASERNPGGRPFVETLGRLKTVGFQFSQWRGGAGEIALSCEALYQALANLSSNWLASRLSADLACPERGPQEQLHHFLIDEKLIRIQHDAPFGCSKFGTVKFIPMSTAPPRSDY